MMGLSDVKRLIVTTALATPLAHKANVDDLGALAGLNAVDEDHIADGAVASAKLADMAPATIKGRAAAGAAGAPTDLSAEQVRTIINVADGASANASDDQLRDRSTHTGEQDIDTVAGLSDALAAIFGGAASSPGLIRYGYGYGTADAVASGAPDALPETPAGLVETVPGRGHVLRLDETDAVLAKRSLITLTPKSVTEAFATFRRVIDTTDPANDTVRVAIRWLGADFAQVGADAIIDDIELTASMEAWRSSALVSRDSDLGADIVAPAGAAYGRLYLKAFGTNGQTDIELMGHQDATRIAALIQQINS